MQVVLGKVLLFGFFFIYKEGFCSSYLQTDSGLYVGGILEQEDESV